MGKPPVSRALAGGAADSDTFSLHTQPGDRFPDHDASEIDGDDLPPAYDESEPAAPLLPINNRAAPPGVALQPFRTDSSSGTQYFMDAELDTSPECLAQHIDWWFQSPPRPFVRLHGTHRETVDKAGKKETKAVTDFDVMVDLTPYLYSDPVNIVSWSELRTVENEEKARRGTVLATRAPGAKQNIELGQDKPSLAEWCHRYQASHAGLKTFIFRRKVTGLDEQLIKAQLTTLVRGTNYRGSLDLTFPVKNATVEIYNECKTNEWRLTRWIVLVCYFTLMFLLTWPYLFVRTKHFEVVIAEWPFSRVDASGERQFVSISEDQWYNLGKSHPSRGPGEAPNDLGSARPAFSGSARSNFPPSSGRRGGEPGAGRRAGNERGEQITGVGI
jgi:hypothetical protein